MSKTNEYLGYARRCELLASRADGDHREMLVEMAQAWTRISLVESDFERQAAADYELQSIH
jgi:hypothetical protein